jgi:hypothetical protein
VLVSSAAVVVLALVGSAAVVVVATLNGPQRITADPSTLRAAGAAALASGGVLLAGALATAAAQFLVVVVAGALSPERLATRLALGRSGLGAAVLAVATVACLAVSSTFDAAFGALGREQTGSIDWLGRVLGQLAPHQLPAVLLVVGGVTPRVIALPERVIGIGRNGRSAWPEYAPRSSSSAAMSRRASAPGSADGRASSSPRRSSASCTSIGATRRRRS